MAFRTGKNMASGYTHDLVGPVRLGPGSGYARKPEDPIVLSGLTMGDLNPPSIGEITAGFHHAITLEVGWRKLPLTTST